tara:strand:+ start:147 stop:353 length:207 start_codon:yes stop_codon:yes gene_type:complete
MMNNKSPVELKKTITLLKQACKTHNRVLELQKGRIMKQIDDALDTVNQQYQVLKVIEKAPKRSIKKSA